MFRRRTQLSKGTRPRGGYAPTRKLVATCVHLYEELHIDNTAIGLKYIRKRCVHCRHTIFTDHKRYIPAIRKGEKPQPLIVEKTLDQILDAELAQIMRNVEIARAQDGY